MSSCGANRRSRLTRLASGCELVMRTRANACPLRWLLASSTRGQRGTACSNELNGHCEPFFHSSVYLFSENKRLAVAMFAADFVSQRCARDEEVRIVNEIVSSTSPNRAPRSQLRACGTPVNLHCPKSVKLDMDPLPLRRPITIYASPRQLVFATLPQRTSPSRPTAVSPPIRLMEHS